MKKSIRNLPLTILIIFHVLVLAGCGLYLLSLTGCQARDNRPTIIESEIWSYYRLGRANEGIALVALNCDSVLTEDGVLYIPTEVDGYAVKFLTGIPGRSALGWGFREVPFEALSARKVVVPQGVAITHLFWSAYMLERVIEFLAEVPDPRNEFFHTFAVIVVPDGSASKYTTFLIEELGVRPEYFQNRFRFIEKSEFDK